MNKSDTLSDVQSTHGLTLEPVCQPTRQAVQYPLDNPTLQKETVPVIARDIKRTPFKVESTSDIVSTNHENAEKFARNLVDVILQRAKSFQTDTVYFP
jgi:hypothetical protein